MCDEATEKRLKSMEGSTLNVEVHSVKHSRPGRHPPHAVKGRRPVGPPRKSEEPQNKCIFCATAHEKRKESCPLGAKPAIAARDAITLQSVAEKKVGFTGSMRSVTAILNSSC